MIQRPFLILAGALLALSALPLHAQSFTLTDGGTLAPIVTLADGHTIGGLDVDSAGDLFYLDVNNSSPDTRLYERSSSGAVADLFDLGSSFSRTPIFGAFVRVEGGEIYLGYGSGTNTTITSAPLGVFGAPLQASHTFTTGVAAYDMAFSPGGTAYLSADPNGFSPGNHVYQFDLTSGSLLSKVSIPNDNSGPLAFDSAGNLLYGTTGGASNSPAGGIYRVSQALLSGPEITLDSTYSINSNFGNAYFTKASNGVLYQSDYASTLIGYPSEGSGAPVTVGAASDDLALSNLASGNGQVYVAASDFGNGNYIFAVPVPEPGSMALLALAAIGFPWRRLRRC